jgi:alpha-L-arabinofuranosidase
MRWRSMLAGVPVVALAGTLEAAAPTVLRVTDEVLRSDIRRMGIGLGGDTFYDAPIRKERIANGGFEGVVYRTLWRAEGGDAQSFVCNGRAYPSWEHACKGAEYRVVSGPLRGQRGRILDLREEPGPRVRFTVDGPGRVAEGPFMFILGKDDSDSGFIGQHGGGWWVFTEGDARVTTRIGDVPPGSQGKVVAVLEAPGTSVAELMAGAGATSLLDPNGDWTLRFWAKGQGSLLVGLGNWGTRRSRPVAPRTVDLTDTWTRHELPIRIEGYALDNLNVSFRISGGEARLDEVSFIKAGDRNPTAFRDPLVTVLKNFRPGVLRAIGMGGSSMENIFRPDTTRMAYAPARNVNPPRGNVWPGHPDANGAADAYDYNLHDFLRLCQEVDADAWFCVPGLVFAEEMEQLMEYLAGPPDTPFGRRRAELGQTRPWTDVLRRIHIEFGNEAWNHAGPYNLRGYNGPDYWHDLIAAAKASPHYRPGVRFQIAGQAVNPGLNAGIASHATNADGFAVAPYVIHELSKSLEEQGPEAVWSHVFGYPWYHGHQGYMAGNYEAIARRFGLELSVYEVNHHITGGDASAACRNAVVAGIGGGINIANWMMTMLQEQNARVQNFFTLLQHHYRAGKDMDVLLWGGVLSMTPGRERYRPTFLAVGLLNRVLGGDLVKIAREGADPTWTCTCSGAVGPRGGGRAEEPFEVPYIQAYAVRDGARRAAVLFNFSRNDALPVRLTLPAPPAGGSAICWTLAADRIDADNEDTEQVRVVEEAPAITGTAFSLALRPFSMTVVAWRQADSAVPRMRRPAGAGRGAAIPPRNHARRGRFEDLGVPLVPASAVFRSARHPNRFKENE